MITLMGKNYCMKNKLLIIFAIISVIIVSFVVMYSSKEVASKEISTLSLNEFQDKLNEGENTLIDIRTIWELKETWIISWAEWLDYYSEDFKNKLSKKDKSKHYLIYCRSWNRSKSALQIMSDLWFEYASDLSGWILLWKKAWLKTIEVK